MQVLRENSSAAGLDKKTIKEHETTKMQTFTCGKLYNDTKKRR